jgi:hypothetical protein
MLVLKGKTFVLSPRIEKDSIKRSELHQLVLENGGRISPKDSNSILIVSGNSYFISTINFKVVRTKLFLIIL